MLLRILVLQFKKKIQKFNCLISEQLKQNFANKVLFHTLLEMEIFTCRSIYRLEWERDYYLIENAGYLIVKLRTRIAFNALSSPTYDRHGVYGVL